MIATRKLLSKSITIATLAMGASAYGIPVYQPHGTNMTYGDVSHDQPNTSSQANPASPAAYNSEYFGNDNRNSGIGWTFSGGLEYGNVEDLFDFIDEVSEKFRPSDPGTPPPPGQSPGDKPDDGIDIGDIIDELFPEFRPALEEVVDEIATQAAILGIIRSEGYAKLFAATEFSFLSGTDMLGGNWSLGISWAGTSKTFGIVDDVEFDLEQALQDLQNQFNSITLPASGLAEFDVAGDVDFIYNTDTQRLGFLFNNDSLLLTKAAKITEFSLSYSRPVIERENEALFLGADANFIDMRLSRLSARFGDITDSDELLDAISDLDFDTDRGFGVDLGALWVAENYHLGATLTNVNEPDFEYPEIDTSNFNDPEIIAFIQQDRKYTMERQLKLEAGLYTASRKWALYAGLDANDAVDPVGDAFQWATISGAYISSNTWVPDFRIGYRKNLAGSEVSYLSIGTTLFNVVNLDISSALDSVSISGDDLPRGLMASMGFNINF